MRARATALLVLGLAALTLASGCGQRGDASASAAGSAAQGPPVGTGERSPTAESTDPCALLSPAARSSAGLTVVGTRKHVAGARACDYTEPGGPGVLITVDERAGLADLRLSEERTRRIRIGRHEALRVADFRADDGTCAVLLGLGESASLHIDVSSADFKGTEQACARATTVAELIEPELT